MATKGTACLLLLAALAGGAWANTGVETLGNYTDPLKIVTIKFDYVEQPLMAITFLLITACFMIAYHHTGIIAAYIPETCVLILIGFAIAAIFKATGALGDFIFDERQFMLFYLPPIVADAAYQLHSKAFLNNIGTILLYAVVGTIVNFFFIGGCLYGLSLAGVMGGDELTTIDAFLYASFIVAVDPVAVIAIFKAVGVNDQLYFMVFGESLFNDAVTIVVFELMASFTFADSIAGKDMALAVGAFIVHSCGAAVIGFLVALLSALVTKFTKHLPILQPVTLYMFAYFAYLVCTLLDWSGIIGLATCCIAQAEFAFQNLSLSSYITLTVGASVAGTVVEALVFLMMGGEMILVTQDWNGMFIMWVILLSLIGRIISVGGLNALANPFRKNKVRFNEQFIMWWAGLRGALAFALATTINVYYPYRQMFITTTITFICFTVFCMGIPMRPLVRLFKIEMKPTQPIDESNLAELPKQHILDDGETSELKRNKLSELWNKAGGKMKKTLSQSQMAKPTNGKVSPISSQNNLNTISGTVIPESEADEEYETVITFTADNSAESESTFAGKPTVTYNEKF